MFVGASSDPEKLGYGLARNLTETFRGAVHLVGRKPGEIAGHPIHTSLESLPPGVDLGVIMVPAAAVPETIEEMGRLGVEAVIVASGGFREVGPEGAVLERRCLEAADRHGMRILGPNCIGVIDTSTPLDTTFLPPPAPPTGSVAFLSHSGALCAAVIDWARGQGFGFSRLVSLGNQVDLTETDLLGPVAEDPSTRVVTLYLEGIGDGPGFVETASHAAVPIVAFKVGRFEAGRRAASSHTGALAGIEAAFDAAFDRAGVLRAGSIEEMFDWARALAWAPIPTGPNVAVLTNAGGPGVAAADAVEQNGLRIASLGSETIRTLRRVLPASASVTNPVDMLASASPDAYAESLRALLADDAVDAVMVILPRPPRYRAEDVVDAIIPVVEEQPKPVVVALMGHTLIEEAAKRLRSAQIPEYRFPSTAAGALGALYRHHCFVEREDAVRPRPVSLPAPGMAPIGGAGWMEQHATTALIEAYGIPTPRSVGVDDAIAAVEAAKRIGYPVALKIDSADVPHKTDVGGVILHLEDDASVVEAFQTIRRRAARVIPDGETCRVVVQEMVGPGQEIVVGVVRDAQFGPLLMFGSGGVDVEGLGDVAFALAPPTGGEVDRLLEETWAGRRLTRARDGAVDRAGVVDVIVRLGYLAVDHPEIEEVEINPLMVTARGVTAVDARIRR